MMKCLSCAVAVGNIACALIYAENSEPWKSDGIQDNSFFVEEAYNQGPGVVQHIFNFVSTVDDLPGADFRSHIGALTQEWPLYSERHQISYTIPFLGLELGNASDSGFGDVAIHYRFQAVMETDTTPAFAPRLSVSLPTGDENDGLGTGEVGYQFNLPFSKVLNDSWTAHFNAGVTFSPNIGNRDLVSYNLGASAIYAVTSDFNFLLEWVGLWTEVVDSFNNEEHLFAAILSPGFRYALNYENGSQLVLGLAAPIGLNEEASDYGVFVYLSFEHVFSDELHSRRAY